MDKLARQKSIVIFLLALFIGISYSLAQNSGIKGGSSQDYQVVSGAIGTIGEKGNGSQYNVTLHGSQQPMGKGNSSNFNASLGYLYTLDSILLAVPIIVYPTNHLATNAQPLPLNVTFPSSPGVNETIFYYINGRLNQTSLYNTTLNASDGSYILNVSLFNNNSFSANATANFTIDTIRPRINSSINNSNPRINWTINITANVSDERELSRCQFITNQSSKVQYFNQTIFGTNQQCSQNFTIEKTRGNVLNFTIIVYDIANNANQSEHIITVTNTPPGNVTQIAPRTNNVTTNRTPEFVWQNTTDADNDTLTFLLNIKCVLCSQDNRLYNITHTNYTLETPLEHLGDDNYFYNWSVTANDGFTYGGESNASNITINSLVSISLLQASINFGAMALGEENTTHDDIPAPFVIENDGNVYVNVSIAANQSIFLSKPLPTSNFQYKIDNTSKLFAYDYNSVNTTKNWTNITLAAKLSIVNLSYLDRNDTAEIDLRIKVPTDEPQGSKIARVILEARYR